MQVYRAYFVHDATGWSDPLLIEAIGDDAAIEIVHEVPEADAGYELWLEDHLIIRRMPGDAQEPGPARVEAGPSPHAHPSVIET